jgi:hypothetical protein
MADHITADPVTPALAADAAAAAARVPAERLLSPADTKGDEQQRPADPLSLDDEADTGTRTKLRIYATVAALYLVLFVAALDQTIIA